MTKRDFESIAQALKTEAMSHAANGDTVSYMAVRDVALQLCITFHAANVRFRQDIFMDACGF